MRHFVTGFALVVFGCITSGAFAQPPKSDPPDSLELKKPLPPKAQVEQTGQLSEEIKQLLASQAYHADTKFPDMKITGLATTVPVKDPYRATIAISAVAMNKGGAAFNFPKAFLVLYRGTQVLAKSPLGNVKPGGVVTVKASVTENYEPPYGAKYCPDYMAKIEYDPYTKALSKNHIDSNFGNNQQSKSQLTIAAKLESDYRTWFRTTLLKLINAYRVSQGRVALKTDPGLTASAQKHSEWMAATGNYQHPPYGPAAGSAENIHMEPDPNKCFVGWKNSKGHNQNMLDSSHTKIGIGQKGDYITACFD